MGRRAWIVPEFVQTSAMDCGPASLTALLEGFGVRASYGRIREACQTEVDGTSIDTLEDVLGRLGFEAEQVMIPVDHLLRRESAGLPAIVVTRLPNGFQHFVVAWRSHGPLVQVMDPASGRRWMSRASFLRDLYVHEMDVPAEAFQEFAASEDFLAPLRGRLRDLGEPDPDGRLRGATSASIAALDAAARMTEQLVVAKAVRRGGEARDLCRALHARAVQDPRSIHDRYWYARPAEDPTELTLRGAVLVTVAHAGAEENAQASPKAELPRELVAALAEPRFRPWHTLAKMVWRESGLRVGVVFAMMALSAFTTLLEALVMRGLIDLTRFFHAHQQRLTALAAVIVLFAAMCGVDWKLLELVQRIGRKLESDLRVAFLSKVPRLGPRYFRSRPASDLAERIHDTHRVRGLPDTVSEIVRDALGLVAIIVGIALVDPRSLLPAVCIGVVSLLLPAAIQPAVRERELRLRTHAGAMLRSYSDALLGMTALRAHVGDRSLRREHEEILTEWAACGKRLLRLTVVGEAIVSFVRVGCLAWLLFGFLKRPEDQRVMLLVTYWVLYMGSLGRRLVSAVRALAPLRNITFRVLEPLGAPEDEAIAGAALDGSGRRPEGPMTSAPEGGMRVELENVGLTANGHRILEGVDLRIAAGEHVGIVGVSGGGKSSLVSLVLGMNRPTAGRVRIDGIELNATTRGGIAASTVWVDPAVHLWNTSLLENLLYGSKTAERVGDALEVADLLEVVERLPDGMQSSIGEGGRLLSGGQGQRVRFGRAVTREPVRLAILDEAFRGLELDRRKDLLRRARKRWARATFLCVTHDVNETMEFGRVLVVEGGCIVEDGDPRELMANEQSRYRALVEADERVRRELWSAAHWRNIRVADGRVEEVSRTP